MTDQKTILFAGGGSGGHIFPAIAIAEQLPRLLDAHFLISNRPVDAQIAENHALDHSVSNTCPLPRKPWRLPAFYRRWKQAVAQVVSLIRTHHIQTVVTVGGFVCGPAAAAAKKENIKQILLNLDAIPGKANRWLGNKADHIFTVYPQDTWPEAQIIGLPIRRQAIGPDDPKQARRELGLDPDRPTLLITGASQGASTLNRMLQAMLQIEPVRQAMTQWQILHLAGERDTPPLQQAYHQAGLDAAVLPFVQKMGWAWRSASVAISRAGAGSVAEVRVNAVPTLFMPYPYHRDQHQRKNALPLVQAQAALLFEDRIDPRTNADQIAPALIDLMQNTSRRERMTHWLKTHRQPDGAAIIAQFLADENS